MADGSEVVVWPSGVEWKPVSSRPPKAAKAAPPDVAFAVGAKGGVTVTVSRALVERLGWRVVRALSLDVIEAETDVFFRLARAKDGQFKLQDPPGLPEGKLAQRFMVRLYKCGGLALGQRRSVGVPFKVVGDVLYLSVPRAGDGKQGAQRQPAVAPLDMHSLINFALDEVLKAWPQAARESRSTAIAAAVALVEFGADRDAVRDLLGISSVLLPEREDMPLPARRVLGRPTRSSSLPAFLMSSLNASAVRRGVFVLAAAASCRIAVRQLPVIARLAAGLVMFNLFSCQTGTPLSTVLRATSSRRPSDLSCSANSSATRSIAGNSSAGSSRICPSVAPPSALGMSSLLRRPWISP